MAAILMIEDEAVLARSLERGLKAAGHGVRACPDAASGLEAAARDLPDLVLLDLRLPDRHGLEVLRELRSLDGALPVIVMTAYASVQDAVQAMRDGAVDYIQKPLRLEEVRILVERTLAAQRRDRELAHMRSREGTALGGLVGRDPRLMAILEQVERIRRAGLAPKERPPILLTGETGTGKGLLAKAIHEILGGGPFIDVNCTALAPSLIEAELFGHERGSFTDAKQSRPGLFAAAEGGALFLDEIGSLEIGLQAKFLKVVEERRVRRIGATQDREVDFYIIAATNRDLDEAVSKGEFRADLRHRLQVVALEVPPLRKRPGDIPLLARHFCAQLGKRYRATDRVLSPEAEQELVSYAWPGNVRELGNVLERALLLGPPGDIQPELIRSLLVQPGTDLEPPAFALPHDGVRLAELERGLVSQAIERANGNRTRAAKLLGLTRDQLRYRLAKYGLE